jgi:hypothetical protein
MIYSIIEVEEDDVQEWEDPFITYCIIEGEHPSAVFTGELSKAEIILTQLVENGLEPENIADFISEEL